jgi:hypothetical protein
MKCGFIFPSTPGNLQRPAETVTLAQQKARIIGGPFSEIQDLEGLDLHRFWGPSPRLEHPKKKAAAMQPTG